MVTPRIAGFKEELVALTGALSRTLETAEGLKNYGHTGLFRNRDLADGITFEVTRHGEDAGDRHSTEQWRY